MVLYFQMSEMSELLILPKTKSKLIYISILMDKRRHFQRNHYINKRNYIIGLTTKNSELTTDELIDLDKYIRKLRPAIKKTLSLYSTTCQFQKTNKQVVISFN